MATLDASRLVWASTCLGMCTTSKACSKRVGETSFPSALTLLARIPSSSLDNVRGPDTSDNDALQRRATVPLNGDEM